MHVKVQTRTLGNSGRKVYTFMNRVEFSLHSRFSQIFLKYQGSALRMVFSARKATTILCIAVLRFPAVPSSGSSALE